MPAIVHVVWIAAIIVFAVVGLTKVERAEENDMDCEDREPKSWHILRQPVPLYIKRILARDELIRASGKHWLAAAGVLAILYGLALAFIR